MSFERPAIAVSRLSKTYAISHRGERPTTLAEKLARIFQGAAVTSREPFEALSDVSFEVGRGEVLGIIGPNGAGKSTLLKVLAGITEPSAGQARLWGRVGSLLEVGTGFHPELTGRENIYLNGCILGIRRTDVERQFDDIVAFSGVAPFLDTPVKHYSSGMFVRLAFAVAAQMNTEILIVDEVLAVGDAEFQARCLGRMKDVTGDRQRTVLFVSHNLQAIRAICDRAIVLSHGRVIADGGVEVCVKAYLGAQKEASASGVARFARPPGASLWMREARIEVEGRPSGTSPLGSHLVLAVDFQAEVPVVSPRLGFGITSTAGLEVIHANNRYQPTVESPREELRAGVMRCDLGQVPLMPGHYTISLWLGDSLIDTHIAEHALSLRVSDRDIWGLGRTPVDRGCPLWWPTQFSVTSESQTSEDDGAAAAAMRNDET